MPKTGAQRPGPWAHILLMALGFTAITLFITVWATQLPGGEDAELGLALRAAVGVAVVVPLVLLACRFWPRSAVSILGLRSPRRGWLTLLWVALASTAAVAVVVTVAMLSGAATVETGALGQAALTAAVVVPLLTAATAVPEELVFRGYIQHLLGDRLAPMSMIATQAALFAACTSIVGFSAEGTVTAFITGVGLGYLRLFSAGLWAVLGLRLALITTSVFMAEANLMFTAAPALWNLGLGVGLFVVALVIGVMLRPKQAELLQVGDHAEHSRKRRELSQKGILYDVGTSYIPGQHSRPQWHPEVVREELRVIHQELHCNAVILFGESSQRLEEAGRMALEQGLYIWLQPRSFDAKTPQVLTHLTQTAEAAQRLRAQHPEHVGLSVGCEVSLLHRGILPGSLHWRTRSLMVVSALAPPYLGWQLNRMLRRMAQTARQLFDGPVSYAAGTWESVGWETFDAVGANYYTDSMTRADYRGGLRRLAATGKPVLITEYGCCSYDGAQSKGGSGAVIMDWSNLQDRRITGDHVRDEQIQADRIEAQLDVFETENVEGAFLCMFIEGDCHYSPDPTRDLDIASFGIVRPPEPDSGRSADHGHWVPKLGYYALARRYSARIPTSSQQVTPE